MAYSYETADEAWYKLLIEFARKNRKNPTEAESLLWDVLRGDRLGISFRRQHIIGDYIADFVCLPRKLIIEVDGGYHNAQEQQIYDERRAGWLESRGYRVLRFSNEEVLYDTGKVLLQIKKELEQI